MEGVIDRSVLGAPEYTWECPECGTAPKYGAVWRDYLRAEESLRRHLKHKHGVEV